MWPRSKRNVTAAAAADTDTASGVFRRGLVGVDPHDVTVEKFLTMEFSLHYVLFPVTNSGKAVCCTPVHGHFVKSEQWER